MLREFRFILITAAVMFSLAFVPGGDVVLDFLVNFVVIFFLITAAMLLFEHVRLKRLPQAVLSVDGHEVVYRYKQRTDGLNTVFESADTQGSPNSFIIIRAPKDVSIAIMAIGLGSTAQPMLPATLAFEGKDLEFLMSKAPTRCQCDRAIPHWTGTLYFGDILSRGEETYLAGSILLVVKDFGEKRKHPKKEPKKRESRLWNLFPLPQPS